MGVSLFVGLTLLSLCLPTSTSELLQFQLSTISAAPSFLPEAPSSFSASPPEAMSPDISSGIVGEVLAGEKIERVNAEGWVDVEGRLAESHHPEGERVRSLRRAGAHPFRSLPILPLLTKPILFSFSLLNATVKFQYSSISPPHRIAQVADLAQWHPWFLSLRFTALDYSLPSHPMAETSKDSLPALQGICLLNGDYSIFSPMTLIELIVCQCFFYYRRWHEALDKRSLSPT
ncbi:hypothetical protein F2Q68_00023639 [Brassica cretica]|uniref:Uncharacterized protein n=1 Tax=Brassica cretica TaxID=69181 RepID=A0A8S9IFX9_BRACR|nr:hypothetical protein F2Q68_00023639 [Brassica cretica]